MYLMETITDKELMTPRNHLFRTKFTQEQIKQAVKMEVYGTNFNDPGGDYCVFKLIDADGSIIATATVEGY